MTFKIIVSNKSGHIADLYYTCDSANESVIKIKAIEKLKESHINPNYFEFEIKKCPTHESL